MIGHHSDNNNLNPSTYCSSFNLPSGFKLMILFPTFKVDKPENTDICSYSSKTWEPEHKCVIPRSCRESPVCIRYRLASAMLILRVPLLTIWFHSLLLLKCFCIYFYLQYIFKGRLRYFPVILIINLFSAGIDNCYVCIKWNSIMCKTLDTYKLFLEEL